MFKITKTTNNIYVMVPVDQKKVNNYIVEKMKLLVNKDTYEVMSPVVKNKLYEMILEIIILEAFKEADIIDKKDKSFVVTLNINDQIYNFMLANISKDEIGEGITIAKTLQI